MAFRLVAEKANRSFVGVLWEADAISLALRNRTRSASGLGGEITEVHFQ